MKSKLCSALVLLAVLAGGWNALSAAMAPTAAASVSYQYVDEPTATASSTDLTSTDSEETTPAIGQQTVHAMPLSEHGSW